jgi:streptomycin 3"-adenylyltransferase
VACVNPAIETYTGAVAAAARRVLGPRLVGAYLHGSAVLGGFDGRRSDVDMILVCGGRLPAGDRAALADAFAGAALACPATGLELSVVQRSVAANPTARPPFELHVTTGPGDIKVVDGCSVHGDADLVLHFSVCRAAGRLIGPGASTRDVFAEVPRNLVLGQLARELAWAADEGSGEYAVLNACRAWQFAVEDRLVSKVAGGRWALAHTDSPDDAKLITAALERQRCEPTPTLDHASVRAFVGRIEGSIRAQSAG